MPDFSHKRSRMRIVAKTRSKSMPNFLATFLLILAGSKHHGVTPPFALAFYLSTLSILFRGFYKRVCKHFTTTCNQFKERQAPAYLIIQSHRVNMGSVLSTCKGSLPALEAINANDKALIIELCRYIAAADLWRDINDILYPFKHPSQKDVECSKGLKKRLHSLGNAVLNYIVSQCRENVAFSGMIPYFNMRNGEPGRASYRFVWLLAERREMTVLNKSSLHYRNTEECLRAGCHYKPSLDLAGGASFQFLSYEVKTPSSFPPALRSFECGLPSRLVPNRVSSDGRFSHKDVVYAYRIVHGERVVRMPWFIYGTRGRRLHIFYAKKFDFWFYEYTENIDEAVHSCWHY